MTRVWGTFAHLFQKEDLIYEQSPLAYIRAINSNCYTTERVGKSPHRTTGFRERNTVPEPRAAAQTLERDGEGGLEPRGARCGPQPGWALGAGAAVRPQGSGVGWGSEWYLLFELLGGVVVDQGHGEGHGLVIAHQRKQHPRVGGGADPSHGLYFPGGLGPDVRRCPSCNEGGTSQGDPDPRGGERDAASSAPPRPRAAEDAGRRRRWEAGNSLPEPAVRANSWEVMGAGLWTQVWAAVQRPQAA